MVAGQRAQGAASPGSSEPREQPFYTGTGEWKLWGRAGVSKKIQNWEMWFRREIYFGREFADELVITEELIKEKKIIESK